jgi:hypothetical protein
MLILLIAFNMGITYAFWASSINDASNQSTGSILIGNWSFGDIPNGINIYDPDKTYVAGDLVWYDGDIYIVKYSPNIAPNEQTTPSGPYNKMTFEYSPINTYQNGDVVWYQGAFYEVLNGGWASGTLPGSNGGWKVQIQNQWVLGQVYTLNDIVYYQGELYRNRNSWTDSAEPTIDPNWIKIGDFTWNTLTDYQQNDIVKVGTTYYKAKWNNTGQDPVLSGQYGAWQTLTAPNWSSSISGGTPYTVHNNILWEALTTAQGQLRREPGTQNATNVWRAINTAQWLQYNAYNVGALVIYNNQVYKLRNQANASLVPGSAYNAWDRIGNPEYAWFNVYALGDHVIYNNEYYKVVNATNANNNVLPGSVNNAWNNLTTFYWYSYNLYQTGSYVVHENQVWVATQTTVNHEPGTTAGASYWTEVDMD